MRQILAGRTSVPAIATVLACLAAVPASAQMTGVPMQGYRVVPGATASSMPGPLREIGFDQNLDQQLPLDARFTDEEGRDIRIGDYYGKRPVILGFVYYECPMLCTQVLGAMTATLGVMSLTPGQDYEVVLVSIDPREKPAQARAKKAEYTHRFRRPESDGGWHFLTGTEPEIQRLAKAAGFRYVWDEQTQQYAHPSGIIVTTPDGRPARYLFGIEYGPRDVRLAVVEASAGKIGSVADNLLLFCYHYDPMTGRYGFLVMRAIRIVAVATLLALGSFVFLMMRRERRRAGGLAHAASA